MPNYPSDQLTDTYDRDLVSWVRHISHRAADLTADFIKSVCNIRSSEKRTIPVNFALSLGSALLLRELETKGIAYSDHLNIPDAKTTLDKILTDDSHDPDYANALFQQVIGYYIDAYAWSGPEELNADIHLLASDEEALLEIVADFLWDLEKNSTSLPEAVNASL